MTVEVKPADLHAERQILSSKFFAYLANPSLAEHNNLVNAMNEYEDMVAKHEAVKRRKNNTYLQQVGRAKRNVEPTVIMTTQDIDEFDRSNHEDSDI